MGNFRLIGGDIRLPAESVVNETVAAATKIDADKLQHLYKPGTSFGLAIGATPVAAERVVFTASGAAKIRAFHALLCETGTDTDVDFDLLVNGVQVLSSVVTLTDADGDRAVSDGSLSSADLVAGDVVSIELAVTSTTGAQGPFAWVEIEENAA